MGINRRIGDEKTMNNKSITKNYLYNMFYQILTIIVPLITTPYLSRVLGAENIGIYSYTLSITTYFILLGTLGISLYGQREIAYFQNDVRKRSKTFFEIIIMRFITIGISTLIFFATFCLKGEYIIYYRILLLELVAYGIDISFYFQGMEEFKKTVLRNSIIKLLSVIFIFILVKEQSDLVWYFLIYVISTFLGNISLWFYLPKYVQKVEFRELNIIRHLKPTIELFIPQVAVQIYTVLDKTMIGTIIQDKAEVGFYEQAQKIVKLVLTIATSLGTVMAPRIANIYSTGNKSKIKEHLINSYKFVLLLVFPLMFGTISVSSKFVPVFYGNGYEKVICLINVISPIMLAIGLSNVSGAQFLIPTKQQNKYTKSVIAGAIINFVLNIILIRYLKSVGASIATVIAEFVITIIQLKVIKDIIKFGELLKIGKRYLGASIVMMCISCILGIVIKNNMTAIIAQIFVSAFVYFAILYIIKDEMVCKGINYIKNKFKILKIYRN